MLSVIPRPGLRCLNVTAALYSPSVETITVDSQIQGTMQYQTEVHFYKLLADYTPDDGLSLRVLVDQVQGGELQLRVDSENLPYSDCKLDFGNTTIPNTCDAIIGGCVVTLPFCKIDSSHYYIGVKATLQYVSNIPVTYILQAEWAPIPSPVQIFMDTLVPGWVVQAQYVYYQ